MNLDSILAELKHERERLNNAIAALEHLGGSVSSRTTAAPKAPRRRGMSAAGRRKISKMMKARWAAKRDAKGRAKTASGTPPKKRRMSAAGRKRISEAAKARWAAWKKAKAA